MNSQAADAVLGAVMRRLRLVALADAARFAAWTTVAIALVAVLLHLFVRPVNFTSVVLTVAACWAGAMIQAAAIRVTTADCAAWADRHLGGRSAYATYLEFAGADERQASSARRRLVEWLDQSAPHGLDRLAALRHDAGLPKPVAVALVAAVLALVLLQVPSHRDAPLSARSNPDTTGGRGSAAAMPAGAGDGAIANAKGAGGSPGSKRGENLRDRPGTMTTPVAANQRASVERVDAAEDPLAAMGATEAASGGRDAGESPDTVPDPGLSDAWQGEMTASLRALSKPPQQQARTDPTLSADFTGAAPAHAFAQDSRITPAAATPPEARRTARLGPAEQAYVRAYFAAPGAEP